MTVEHKAIPPQIDITNIESMYIEQGGQSVKVDWKGRVADYPIRGDETLSLANDMELREATMQLERIAARRLKEPLDSKKEVKCEACNANCCTHYDFIAVFEHDVSGLAKAVGLQSVDIETQLEELKKLNVITGKPSMGQVGWLGTIYIKEPEVREITGGSHSCVFLTWDERGVGRCGIYENRPQTCRDYKERSCELQSLPVPTLYKIRKFGAYKGTKKIWKGEPFDSSIHHEKYPHALTGSEPS